jgi:hypothetical protein
MAEFKWLGTTVTNQYMTDEKVYCRLHCFQNLVFSSVTTKSFWFHTLPLSVPVSKKPKRANKFT